MEVIELGGVGWGKLTAGSGKVMRGDVEQVSDRGQSIFKSHFSDCAI